MKKLNITKERFEKSRYFQKKYGELEYVSESGRLFKTNKGKVLMFKESTDGGKASIERLCTNLEKQHDTLTYDEIEGKLKEAGFVLDEYGGKTNAYAVFVHDCGIVANVEYRFVKDYGTRDSWHAADVTYFGWYDDPDYQRWSTESTKKFGKKFDEEQSFKVNEAIPKTLKEIPQEQAERLIQKHLRAGTGEWESSPGYSDFIYEIGGGRYKLIRPGFGGRYETGIVSM